MKAGRLFGTFRFRIVAYTTLGVLVMVSSWIFGVHQMILQTWMEEAAIELRSKLFRGNPRSLSYFPGYRRPFDPTEEDPYSMILMRVGFEGDIEFTATELNFEDLEPFRKELLDIEVEPAPSPDEFRPGGFDPGKFDPSTLKPEEAKELLEKGFREFSRSRGPESDRENPPRRKGPVVRDAITMEISGEKWVCIATGFFENRILYGSPLAPVYERGQMVLFKMLSFIPLIFIVTLFITWTVTHKSLRSIKKMSDLAGDIDVDKLNQRLVTGPVPTEFQKLVEVFNEMLDRLEKSFKQSRRFSADASHELKTPLTIMQGRLEREIQQAETGSERQQRMVGLLDEVNRLKGITNRLLLLTRSDSGQLKLTMEKVDIREIIEEIVSDFDNKEYTFRFQPKEAKPLCIEGDSVMIRKMFQNLYENAIKYNRHHGKVVTKFTHLNGVLQIDIGNNGQSIPTDLQDHVFDRFFRVEHSHNRKVDGTGLGLSLVKEIIKGHGGDVVLLESKEDWTEFRLTFPL